MTTVSDFACVWDREKRDGGTSRRRGEQRYYTYAAHGVLHCPWDPRVIVRLPRQIECHLVALSDQFCQSQPDRLVHVGNPLEPVKRKPLDCRKGQGPGGHVVVIVVNEQIGDVGRLGLLQQVAVYRTGPRPGEENDLVLFEGPSIGGGGGRCQQLGKPSYH